MKVNPHVNKQQMRKLRNMLTVDISLHQKHAGEYYFFQSTVEEEDKQLREAPISEKDKEIKEKEKQKTKRK